MINLLESLNLVAKKLNHIVTKFITILLILYERKFRTVICCAIEG